jgi:cytochrome c-type biogenesis protein CcmF
LSREGMIVINNLFLLTACATVLLGTVYPMFSEWLAGEKLTVGPPYFNATFLPLMAVPLLFAGLTPFMPWKQARLGQALREAAPAFGAALAVMLLVLATAQQQLALGAMGLGLAAWLAASSLQWMIRARGRKGALPVFLAHTGAAVLLAGLTGAGLWKQENERWISIGDSMDIAGYHLLYQSVSAAQMPNYRVNRSHFLLTDAHGRTVAALTPEYRVYDIRKSASSVAAIVSTPAHDLYVVTGESTGDGKRVSVRSYYNPLIGLIWAGCVLMASGGLMALVRRKRPWIPN